MKILQMVHSLPDAGKKAGGVSVTVKRLAEGFSQVPGCSVTVGCLSGGNGDDVFEVWYPVGTGFLSRLCKSRLGIYFLYPLILNFKQFSGYDVIHFHGEDWFFLNRRGVKVVRTMHGASKRECAHTDNVLRKALLLIGNLLECSSARLADRLLCVGSDTQEIFGSPHYIGNGYSPDKFYPGKKSEVPVVFYNGYWKGRKRGELAYEIFVNEVLPKVPDAELWFLADSCPEHPQVKLFCGVTDEVLGNLYRESWVFLYPSSYEGFGMAYVEAMASGTVVVASGNPGSGDVLQGGKAGVLAGDDKLGSVVVRLLLDKEYRVHWERLGLERAKDFTVERVVDQHLAHFREVIDS
ncbi:glycosyltransferase family 4 protein [Roseibacillus persicicus]|nr:glycosyltransferase family 4 protein [Roseibacillus persicicus]